MPPLILVPLLVLEPQAAEPEGCQILITGTGGLVTVQGAVSADWQGGNYDLTLSVEQNGNHSLSRQAGEIGTVSSGSNTVIVVSSTSVYMSRGGRLVAQLDIARDAQQASCSVERLG